MNDRNVEGTLSKPEIHERWIKGYRNEVVDGFIAEVINHAIQFAELPRGAAVLDAGCGSGTNSIRLMKSGFAVTGVDFSEFAIKEATGKLAAAGLSLDLTKADLTNLPFDNETFDAVFCIGVLMHIPTFQSAVLELVRVLKPNGKLVISEVNDDSLEMRAYKRYWKIFPRQGLQIERHPFGTEAWLQTESGPLVSRKMNIKWFEMYLEKLGMKVRYRGAGAFTELFRVVQAPVLRSAVIAFNRFWFKIGGPASLSTGFIVICQKEGGDG